MGSKPDFAILGRLGGMLSCGSPRAGTGTPIVIRLLTRCLAPSEHAPRRRWRGAT